jgi:predicted nucleotidyltransferase
MFSKERRVLKELADILANEAFILKIIAYGSRVRGDFNGDSDLDVFVLVEKKDRYIKDKIIDLFYSYEMKFDIPFSVIILSREEFDLNDAMGSPFIKSIKEEGILIYDSQPRGEEFALEI